MILARVGEASLKTDGAAVDLVADLSAREPVRVRSVSSALVRVARLEVRDGDLKLDRVSE